VDPFTILTLIGAGGSLFGGLLSAEATGREAAMNAAELERSARQAEAARLDALRRGQLAEARRRLEVGQVRGAQTVAYSAGNIDASTGTAAQVGMATDAIGELDAMTLRANAWREAFGFQETARSMRIKASQTRENAATNIFNAVAGGIGGAASAAAPAFRKGG